MVFESQSLCWWNSYYGGNTQSKGQYNQSNSLKVSHSHFLGAALTKHLAVLL